MSKELGTVGFEEEIVQPSDLTGLATKQEVTDETTAREQADSSLGERINQEASERQQADEALSARIDAIKGLSFELVASLSDVANPKSDVIYLVPNGGAAPNIKDEYIYVNGVFEKIGTTEIDLSKYVRQINQQTPVNGVISLTAADVGAANSVVFSNVYTAGGWRLIDSYGNYVLGREISNLYSKGYFIAANTTYFDGGHPITCILVSRGPIVFAAPTDGLNPAGAAIRGFYMEYDSGMLTFFDLKLAKNDDLLEKQDVIRPGSFALDNLINMLGLNDLDAIRSNAEAGAASYQKPASGIPASDLASGVVPKISGEYPLNTMDDFAAALSSIIASLGGTVKTN